MKVTATIPVYDEQKTIKNVLNVLAKFKQIDEIILVNDASTDDTLKIVRFFYCKKRTGKTGT